MHTSKIGTMEAIMILLTIVATHTVLSLPKTLLSVTKSASIINIIYVSILALLLVIFIVRLFKKFPGMDLLDISEYLAGSFFKKVLGILFISYFIVSSSILLRSFCECLKIVYFPDTDLLFLIVLFIVAVCIANRLSFTATLKTNLLVIPIVLVSVVFLFLANFRNFTLERMYPILGDGFWNTFVIGIGNISAFGGIAYLYFLPPLLKKPEQYKKIAITSVVITGIYLLLTVATILFMFSFFTTEDEIMPLFSAARYIEFGTFFQRLESIFLLIWISAFCCYLSVVMKFSVHILQKITLLKDTNILIPCIGLFMLAIALFPENYAISKFYENTIYRYFVWGFVLLANILILILANLKKRKKVGETHVQMD